MYKVTAREEGVTGAFQWALVTGENQRRSRPTVDGASPATALYSNLPGYVTVRAMKNTGISIASFSVMW